MNENIKLALKKLAKSEANLSRIIMSYLETGNLADQQSLIDLSATTKLSYGHASDLENVLTNSSDYENLTDQSDQWRLVHVLLIIRPSYVWSWVDRKIWREDEDTFGLVWKNIQIVNTSLETKLKSMKHMKGYFRSGGEISLLGQFSLSLDLEDLLILAGCSISRELMVLILNHADEKFEPVFDALLSGCEEKHKAGFALALLEEGETKYLPLVFNIYKTLTDILPRYRVMSKIYAVDASYKEEVLALAKDAMKSDDYQFKYLEPAPASFVAENCGLEAVDLLVEYIKADGDENHPKLAEKLAKSIGIKALPVLQQIITNQPHSSYKAYKVWGEIDVDNECSEEILAGISEKVIERSYYWQAFAKVGVSWNLELMGPMVWPLLSDKSKVIRDEAIDILINVEGVVEKAIELLAEGQATLRETGVTILLKKKNREVALAAVREHVKTERSKKIRNIILAALGEEVPVEEVKELGLEDKVKQLLKKQKKPVTPWINELSLSPFICQDGSLLSEDHFNYMLAVQSKTKGFELDTELNDFYARLDRTKNADAAYALLDGFFNNGENVKEKWVLLIAGLLGDQRIVMALDNKISSWAMAGRGKLSEYAVMAIAMQSSEAALVVIDDVTRKFATKYGNIGEAAQVAFSAAAKNQGISVDELGDRVIPWLGFEPNQPRIVMAGDRVLNVYVGGPAMKFIYFDVEKNKVVKTLPKTVADDVKQSLKDDAALLRQVVKAQTKRLEALMVRQHRWPVERWCELFLNHPILKSFGERLVWGHYNDDGILLDTCRVLEDGTLTDVNEEDVEHYTGGGMGIVHPLELAEEQRNAWIEALEDYEVQPPFVQLKRPIYRRSDEDRQNKLYAEYVGTRVDGYAFKGRTEKRGWVKGYVGDAGSVDTVHKMFPALGLVATLRVEDFGAVIYDDVTMGELFFENDSADLYWGYSAPQVSDKRLVNINDVTDLVWSEIMADLTLISEAAIG